MNSIMSNDLFGYFQTLYEANRKFIMLCGHDCHNMQQGSKKLLLDLIQDLFKLLPFVREKNNEVLKICKTDGLLEYDEHFGFLYNDYANILNKYHRVLYNLKKIRNKYEHKMHALKEVASGDGSFTMFEFEFEVEDKGEIIEKTITYRDIVGVLKNVNILFSKMQNEVEKYALENNILTSSYYIRLLRVNFIEFNRIIDSDIVRLVGKTMFDF